METGNSESVATKMWWRHWSVVFILAVLAAFVVWALIKAGPWLRGWQERRAADTLREQAGNLIYNRLAIKYPWLGLAEREQRRRILRAKRI